MLRQRAKHQETNPHLVVDQIKQEHAITEALLKSRNAELREQQRFLLNIMKQHDVLQAKIRNDEEEFKKRYTEINVEVEVLKKENAALTAKLSKLIPIKQARE